MTEGKPSAGRADLLWKGTQWWRALGEWPSEASWGSSPNQGDLGLGLEKGLPSIIHGHMLLLESPYSSLATWPHRIHIDLQNTSSASLTPELTTYPASLNAQPDLSQPSRSSSFGSWGSL